MSGSWSQVTLQSSRQWEQWALESGLCNFKDDLQDGDLVKLALVYDIEFGTGRHRGAIVLMCILMIKCESW